MSDRTSEFIFDAAEELQLEASLRPLDPFLQDLARTYRLRLLRHSSKGWPGRTLHRRKWLKTYSLRVSLDPAYENVESPIRWEIHEVWMVDAGELGRKPLSFRPLAKDIDGDRVNSDGIRDIIRTAVGKHFAL